MKKYKLTSETKEYGSLTLFRIEAVRDFGGVEKGDKGGFVEKEDNLSHDGDAWVSGDAEVYGDAKVYGDAEVSGDAEVYGDAWVSGNAKVYGNAWVYGDLKLIGGYFYHTKEKDGEIEKVEVDKNYELLCSEPELAEEENGKKQELLTKADELIAKAEELKQQAEEL